MAVFLSFVTNGAVLCAHKENENGTKKWIKCDEKRKTEICNSNEVNMQSRINKWHVHNHAFFWITFKKSEAKVYGMKNKKKTELRILEAHAELFARHKYIMI